MLWLASMTRAYRGVVEGSTMYHGHAGQDTWWDVLQVSNIFYSKIPFYRNIGEVLDVLKTCK
jgi:hypothetical protein